MAGDPCSHADSQHNGQGLESFELWLFLGVCAEGVVVVLFNELNEL